MTLCTQELVKEEEGQDEDVKEEEGQDEDEQGRTTLLEEMVFTAAWSLHRSTFSVEGEDAEAK